jgi:hypothetical protein
MLRSPQVERHVRPRLSRRMPPSAQLLISAAAVIVMLALVFSPSAGPVFASALCLLYIVWLLWRPGHPSVLLLAPLYQWTEVAVVPISTLWKQVPLNDLSAYGADLETAAYFGLSGVAALATGLGLALRFAGRDLNLQVRMERWAKVTPWRDIRTLAACLVAAGVMADSLAGLSPPLREPLLAIGRLQYAGLFVMAYWCLQNRSHLRWLVTVFLLYAAYGLVGFFAGFKDPLLVLFAAVLCVTYRRSLRGVTVLTSIALLFIVVGSFWSFIKADYRGFVSLGTGQQVVAVDLKSRVNYVAREGAGFGVAEFATGLDTLVERHGYIDFLGVVMRTVPSAIPHEDGGLTRMVLAHVTMPRFLFPSKPELVSDSVVASYYTGGAVRVTDSTSISIGHLGELYIDFGISGALLGMALIGLIVGMVYIFCVRRATSAVLGVGLGILPSLALAYFGTAYIKLVGGGLFVSIVAMASTVLIRMFGSRSSEIVVSRYRRN